jgi:hypothetical protein
MNQTCDPQMMVVGGERRRGGRPRAESPLTPVTIWISHNHHDRLIRLANLHEMSVSALGRKVVERAVDRAIE